MTGCVTHFAWVVIVAIGCIIGAERGISAEQTALTFFLGVILAPAAYLFFGGWASSKKTPKPPPEPQDNIIRSDVPYHPEYATQRAAGLAWQRMTGRNTGPVMHVYVNSDPEHADQHSQQLHINWMLENDRAAKVGVVVHQVGWLERDRMGAQRGRVSNTWINGEPFVDGETKSGGNPLALFLAVILVAGMVGFSLYCAYVLWWK